ncbi:unnamed protein product [Calypogeia fissa]
MNRFCEVCGMADMVLGDSSLYCRNCGAQSNQYIEEAFDADDAHIFNTTFVRERGTLRNAEQQQQQQQQSQQPQSQPPGTAPDDPIVGLDGLADLFGSLQDREEAIELTPEVFNGSLPFSVKTEDLSQPLGSQYGGEFDPTSRMSKDELASTIRKSYLNGLQKILQLQLECLVKEFHATPLICGIAGPIWLRFVASTRVFEKAWADEAVMVAEHREKIRRGSKPRASPAEVPNTGDGAVAKQKRKREKKDRPGPRTSYGRHLSFVWLSALKQRIPLSMTLAVSFLSCYIAREPILAMDITKWAMDGQLPYLAAFVEISKSAPPHIPNTVGEKQIFPMKPKLMFQPINVLGARFLENQAGFVAERVGLQLPPVNFHGICAIFLRNLGLPVEKLLPFTSRLYEWYAPAGLFLSTRRKARFSVLSTRVYVMAVLVITLKVLYNLDGRPLQQEEETNPHRRKGKSPTSNEKNDNEVPHRMMTRTRAKRQAVAENSVDKEQLSNPEKKVDGTQTGVGTSRDDDFSVPGGQVLGKRKRSQTVSGDERGGQDGGELVLISGENSGSKSGNVSAEFHKQQKGLGDTKELLERLESTKTSSTADFDEELGRYLKYCQNVIFAGDECDPGMEPVLERFWGIYEKNMTKGEKELVVSLDEEAGPSELLPSQAKQKGGTAGTQERAGSLEREAPSAGSSMPDWGRRPEVSKQNTEEKGKEIVLHTATYDPPSSLELQKESTKKRDTKNLIADMKKSGFSLLPPLADDVGWDEYVRYNFQDAGKELAPIHEDYFRVLQACAKLISVRVKALHQCVQKIERGLVHVESDVEQFLLREKNPNVIELAKAVKRRKPKRRRDKIAQAEDAKARAAMTQHVKDLSYL